MQVLILYVKVGGLRLHCLGLLLLLILAFISFYLISDLLDGAGSRHHVDDLGNLALDLPGVVRTVVERMHWVILRGEIFIVNTNAAMARIIMWPSVEVSVLLAFLFSPFDASIG